MVTFRQLCPEWSKALKDLDNVNQKLIKKKGLRMDSFEKCIAGEAYHFNSDYASYSKKDKKCHDCIVFAHQFDFFLGTIDHGATKIDTYDKVRFEETKKEFLKHMKEKHKK